MAALNLTPHAKMLGAIERMGQGFPSPDSRDFIYAAEDILGVVVPLHLADEIADEIWESDCACSLENEPFATMVLHLVADAAEQR